MKASFASLPILCALMTIARAALAADVSGTWAITITAQSGTSRSMLVLAQQGESITGSYEGRFGEAPVAGTLKSNDLMLAFRTEMQGVPIEVTYVGKVDGNHMSGKVTVAGFGNGTFEGTKQ